MRRRFRIRRQENAVVRGVEGDRNEVGTEGQGLGNAVGTGVEGDRNEFGTEGQGLGNAVGTGVKGKGMKLTLRVKDSASIARILFPVICG